jgi:hypothetical protein
MRNPSPVFQALSRRTVSRKGSTQRTSYAQKRWLVPSLFGAAALAIGILVFWLFQLQVASTYAPEVTGRPSAVIDQTSFDYGNVKNNTPVTTVFRVRNVGDRELTFQGEPRVEVVEGCCPPRAALGATTLRPGEETSVTLRFMMHEGMDGPHDFRVHVVTNDPANPEQQVAIRSNWVP